MNLVAVVMLCGGVVLMYSAVKGKDPRDVIGNALGKKDTHGSLTGAKKDTQGASLPPGPKDGTQIVTV
jgi:hypothetical protein